MRNECDRGEAKTVHFDAVLYPHRSLPPSGFIVLMTAVALCSFVVGLAFWIAGAWPVVGFLGLDVVLIYMAFKLNYRDARRCETLRLTDAALEVERFVRGRKVFAASLQSYWLRVRHETEENGPGRLLLASHGRELEVGAFLSGTEKSDLAQALGAALAVRRQG